MLKHLRLNTYDYLNDLIKNDNLVNIAGEKIDKKDITLFTFFALVVDLLKGKYFNFSQSQLALISITIKEMYHPLTPLELDNLPPNHQLWFADNAEVLETCETLVIPPNSPIREIAEKLAGVHITDESGGYFLEGVPAIKSFYQTKRSLYTLHASDKIMFKIAEGKTKITPGEIQSFKLLLQENNKHLEQLKRHNEGNTLIYSLPSYLKDLSPEEHKEALKARRLIQGFFKPTFDEQGALNPGHQREEKGE